MSAICPTVSAGISDMPDIIFLTVDQVGGMDGVWSHQQLTLAEKAAAYGYFLERVTSLRARQSFQYVTTTSETVALMYVDNFVEAVTYEIFTVQRAAWRIAFQRDGYGVFSVENLFLSEGPPS
jgi:hypothetical protein